MADSAALRKRRERAHKRGDHSLCEPSRCRDQRLVTQTGHAETEPVRVEAPASRDRAGRVTPVDEPAPPAVQVPPLSARVPGGIETAVQAFVDALPYGAGDHRSILGEVAVQLARRVDETGALPAAVRELRVLLAQLGETPNGPAGEVDELRLRRAQRRLDALIAAKVS